MSPSPRGETRLDWKQQERGAPVPGRVPTSTPAIRTGGSGGYGWLVTVRW
jgi:hypothetical protein